MENMSLPQDLVEEILSRVPAKSLSRFRSTSKQCNALLKRTSFAKKHSANAAKEPLIIMSTNSRVYLMKLDLHAIHNNYVTPVNLGAQLYLEDPLSSGSQVDVREVFHCDGLLLCATRDDRLVVLNPCSGETTWIKPRDRYEGTDYYALGYDKSKKYKILRVERHKCHNEYEIYDSTSDSWRVLGYADWSLTPNQDRGVSVKGNSYWLGFNDSIHGEHVFLLSFDFSTERFHILPLPQPSPYMISGISVIGEEEICLLASDFVEYPNLKFVWVRNSEGPVTAWRKFITVRDWYANSCTYGGRFLVDEEKKVVVWCKVYSRPEKALHIMGEDNHIRVNHNGGLYTDLQYYVPSLAQFHQGKECT